MDFLKDNWELRKFLLNINGMIGELSKLCKKMAVFLWDFKKEKGRKTLQNYQSLMLKLYFLREIIIICCSHKGIFLHSLFYIDPFEPQRRLLPVKKSRQQLQREKALQEQSQKLGLQDGSTSLPPEQLLSAPKQRFNTQRPCSSPPTPPTLTSPIGDGKPQGIESQPGKLGLKNSHEGHKNAEVLPPKPDCKLEKKKVELLVSLYIHATFFHFNVFFPLGFEEMHFVCFIF